MKNLLLVLCLAAGTVSAQKQPAADLIAKGERLDEKPSPVGPDVQAVIDVDRDEDPAKPDIEPTTAFALVVEDVDVKTAISAANDQFLVDRDYDNYTRTCATAVATAKSKVFEDHDVNGYYKKR